MRRGIFVLMFLFPFSLMAGDFDGISSLVKRRVPWLDGHLVFKKIGDASGGDVFTLSSVGGKVVIGASGANAAAEGLDWYLKYYCHRSMSHMGDNLAPVSPLPVVREPISIKASAQYRHALNYCTYNYTMSFYNWKDWEHELDWMALNGVNLMLVANGEEAVWQNVLRRLGYAEKEIADFLTGPAYNAWWLMGNIEGWGGPMPQSQIDSRKELVQKMLERMGSLGIQPVMPCFFGMVPSTLKNKTKAHIITQGNWGAFTRPDILDPGDTAFDRIAGIFYDETRKLYGQDLHFFSGDPFHEGGITDGVDLGRAGRNIQQAMQRYFPGSTWVLQGWQQNPRKEMLAGVDKNKILVQELFGETTNNWEKRNAYEGTPFVWCMITNYGERPGLFGKLQRYADEPYRAGKGEFASYIKGVGIMPEGINNNPVAYDLMLEVGWHQERVDVSKWIENYVLYRYGKYDASVVKAWKLFLQTIYSSPEGYQEGPPENILCARPALQIKSVSSWGVVKKTYDKALYREAVQLFARAAPNFKGSDTYTVDLINFARQVLANRADDVFNNWVRAYNKKDTAAFNAGAGQFLRLSDLAEDLLNSHAYYRLPTYQQQAMDAGNTAAEKKNNLLNEMMLITYWGEHNRKEDYLHEYAYKEWAGMMHSFYGKRWEMYFEYLREQLRGGQGAAPDFFGWERDWVKKNLSIKKVGPIVPLDRMVYKILKEDPAGGVDSTVVSFVSPDTRYVRDSLPSMLRTETKWTGTGWKGEKLHTQLLVWSNKALKNVRVLAGPLKDEKGGIIPAGNVEIGFIRYVMTDGLNKEGHGCGIPPAHEWDSSLVADGIDRLPAKDLPANTVQPVWISIRVPRGIKAGLYSGRLGVAVGGRVRRFDYSIKVLDHELPAPDKWHFHLDLWQNPYSIARVHHVALWSAAHFEAMRPYMRMLADAGQKAITVSMIHDPWRGQTYDIYQSMIKWIKGKDGAWRYDYTVFDKWVSFMMGMGIDKLINCYTMVPWNNRFYYYDESLGRDTLLIAPTGTPAYEAHWRSMLTSFSRHLKEKGWYERTAIAMDERPLEDMKKVIALVRSVDSGFKISLAGSYHREIEQDIYDYSITSGERFDPEVLKRRQLSGQPATYYTCCTEGFPNTFTFSPPAESEWLGWFAANRHFDGYLRWAFNCWPSDPLHDSRFGSWSAGDTYLVYPGGGSSIRFERLIGGIQDFEKIRLLKELFLRAKQSGKLARLQEVTDRFEIEALQKTAAAEMLRQSRSVLDSL